MGARGRQPNLLRVAARDAGEKKYRDAANPCWCGSDIRYTVNAQCVDCSIAIGRTRYASLSPEQLAKWKADDRTRHLIRSAKRKSEKEHEKEGEKEVDDSF